MTTKEQWAKRNFGDVTSAVKTTVSMDRLLKQYIPDGNNGKST
jgi:hypothetical protein